MITSSPAAADVQRLSHVDLIETVTAPIGSRARLDAIVVPAGRPANNLFTAIDLAKRADCHLVVLCSLRTRPREVRKLFAARGLTKGIAVEIPSGYALPGLDLETTRWAQGDPGHEICGGRKSDLSVKRNAGLLMARMLKWRHIFFMDDDIRGVTHADLTRTVSLLDLAGGGYKSAGIRVKYFPDNSVVCHARREIGARQDVFTSGSVLAVDCTRDFSFFPDIYNEDWLFFHEDVATRRMASPDLHATKMQLRYKPFADPGRAEREEFGDVIAEGLYSLLHGGQGLQYATREYWQHFMDHRAEILDEIIGRVGPSNSSSWIQVFESISQARKTLAGIQPDMCLDYVKTWQRDLVAWKERLTELQPVPTIKEALGWLGLGPL